MPRDLDCVKDQILQASIIGANTILITIKEPTNTNCVHNLEI